MGLFFLKGVKAFCVVAWSKHVLRSARCVRGDMGAPRDRARLRCAPPVTSPAGLKARRCSPGRFPSGRAARGFYLGAAGRRGVAPRTDAALWCGAAVSPALVFPPPLPFPGPSPVGLRPRLRPRAASGRRPLLYADHRPGANPSPFTRCARSLGATARRPFSSLVPPPFGSPRLKSPAAC